MPAFPATTSQESSRRGRAADLCVRIMNDNRITQEELADAVGIDRSQVARQLSGQYTIGAHLLGALWDMTLDARLVRCIFPSTELLAVATLDASPSSPLSAGTHIVSLAAQINNTLHHFEGVPDSEAKEPFRAKLSDLLSMLVMLERQLDGPDAAADDLPLLMGDRAGEDAAA